MWSERAWTSLEIYEMIIHKDNFALHNHFKLQLSKQTTMLCSFQKIINYHPVLRPLRKNLCIRLLIIWLKLHKMIAYLINTCLYVYHLYLYTINIKWQNFFNLSVKFHYFYKSTFSNIHFIHCISLKSFDCKIFYSYR